MQYLKCCLNWKVIAGLGVAGLAVWVAAPTVFASVLPVLLGLICPLSMIAMIVGMGLMSGKRPPAAPDVSREERLEQLRQEQRRIDAQLAALSVELEARASGAPVTARSS